MKRQIQFLFVVLVGLLLPMASIAQEQGTEMADQFREDGKIYVVVAVVTTILIGMVVYLFTMERKINKLEKELNK